jgi:hypothetical protein
MKGGYVLVYDNTFFSTPKTINTEVWGARRLNRGLCSGRLGQESLTTVWLRNLDKNPLIAQQSCFQQQDTHVKKRALVAFTAILTSMLIGMHFAINSHANPITYRAPEITVLSPPQGGLYNTSDVPLNVTVQLFGYSYSGNLETIQWLNYSIDTKTPLPITVSYLPPFMPQYNATAIGLLSGLSNGLHNLVIQGETDYNGSIYSRINFTVNVPQSSSPKDSTTSQPESFPAVPVAVSIAAVATVSAILLIYWKKRKREF